MSELQTFPDERREPAASDVPFVLFDRVSLSFDDNVVLRDVSVSLLTGHMAMLLGASGSGKSVILKLILGLLRPDEGEIFIKGERIDAMPEADLMRCGTTCGRQDRRGSGVHRPQGRPRLLGGTRRRASCRAGPLSPHLPVRMVPAAHPSELAAVAATRRSVPRS